MPRLRNESHKTSLQPVLPTDLPQRRYVNPYLSRLNEFPERLFTFSNETADRSRIEALRRSASELICELGCGSGAFLLEIARRRPRAMLFGFELRFKRSVRTIEKALRDKLENVYLLHTDARNVLEIFGPQSISAVYLNFPDPWAKRREQKHRLLSADFIGVIAQLLKPGGTFSFKTDHEEYFESALRVIESSMAFEGLLKTRDLYQSAYLTENIQTEFERLFISQKLPIYYLHCQLSSGPLKLDKR